MALDYYLKKRDVLWNPRTSPSQLSAYGREFLARESFSDALDFFEKAKDEAGVSEIKKIALEQGDTFLLARLERYKPSLVTEADWQSAEKTAERLGKPSMAEFARKKLAPPAAEVAGKLAEQPLEEV